MFRGAEHSAVSSQLKIVFLSAYVLRSKIRVLLPFLWILCSGVGHRPAMGPRCSPASRVPSLRSAACAALDPGSAPWSSWVWAMGSGGGSGTGVSFPIKFCNTTFGQ